MRSTLIKMGLAISFIASISPQVSSATTSPSFSCSANLVVSLDNGYSASCDGDFSFTDGVLQNDMSISLTAGGLLDIGANASLNAPFISLNSKDIFVGGILNAPNGEIKFNSVNSIVIASGSQTNVAGNSIIQAISKAIVDWNAFNIQLGASVNVDSGKTSWNVLNRVNEPTGEVLTGAVNFETPLDSKVNLLSGDIQLNSSATLLTSGEGSGIRPALNIQGGQLVLSNGSGILTLGANLPLPGIAVSNIVAQVPEPLSYLMMLLGLASVALVSRRKN